MKRIAITQRVDIIKSYGERRDCLSQEWISLLLACDFMPIIIPNNLKAAKKLLASISVDGILLTGGNDLVEYGGDAPERDETERFLLELAISDGLPLLGVCRGMQVLLNYFGGSLCKVENHIAVEHEITAGNGELQTVNSFHAFGTFECPMPLSPIFRTKDGVIEAVSYKRLYGIMWHIERYAPFRAQDIEFLKGHFK